VQIVCFLLLRVSSSSIRRKENYFSEVTDKRIESCNSFRWWWHFPNWR